MSYEMVVQSNSKAGLFYRVTVKPPTETKRAKVLCDCPDFKHRRQRKNEWCKHITFLFKK